MRWQITIAAVAVCALLTPTAASGYTFGEWASDQGYEPNAVMPETVYANNATIDSLSGIHTFDWTTTPTTDLRLDDNQLTSIEPGDFDGLTNLTELRLYDNQLTSIEAGDFSGLTNLTRLVLGNNQLSSIESGAFDGLTNLEDLRLEQNQISSIEPGDFQGLPNLEWLNLHRNQLSSIEAGDFDGLPNLTGLSIGGNISSLAAIDLSDVSNLTVLSLSGNQISSIEEGDFSELTSLTTLELGDNQISSIDAGDFAGVPSLTKLYLAGNQLTSIEAGAFEGLTNLTQLLLHGNQLSSIEAGDFEGLTNLKTLLLDRNFQLANFEPGAFSGLGNLVQLWLRNNPGLTELNLAEADFSSLYLLQKSGSVNITRVSLNGAVLNQNSLNALMDDSFSPPPVVPKCSPPLWRCFGLEKITELDLSGVDFAEITSLQPLYYLDRLTDLWLVGTQNLDAVALDALLDNLAKIQGTDVEGVLYMTRGDYDAFNAAGGGLLEIWHNEPGHHVAFVPEPATLVLCCIAVVMNVFVKRGGALCAG